MQFIKKTLKNVILVALALSVFSLSTPTVMQGAWTTVPTAYAQEAGGDATTTDPQQTFEFKDLVETTAKISTYTNRIFNPVIFFLSSQIGNFLNNDYIYAGNMGEMLQKIWVVSRNIVNIAFVLILLFLAVRHIFSGDESNSDLKKLLPKFVILLIAVNFTWLGTRIVLDAASISTNVMFQIPAAISSPPLNNCEVQEDGTKGSCRQTHVYYPAGATKTINYDDASCPRDKLRQLAALDKAGTKDAKVEGAEDLKDKVVMCWDTMDIKTLKANNASLYLTYSIARVQNLTKAGGISVDKIAVGAVVAFVVQIIYVIAFAALWLALIFRVAALWLFIAFSPFLVLTYFLKDLGQSGALDQLSFGEFARWAFAPTLVAGVFSIGFLMLTAGQASTELFIGQSEVDFSAGSVESAITEVESLFAGMSTVQEFIWLLMTVGIIWVGTFVVLSKLKGVGFIFDKVNQYGRRFAGEVARSPTWAPIMPVIDSSGKITRGSYAGNVGPLGKLQQLRSDYTKGRSDAGTRMSNAIATNNTNATWQNGLIAAAERSADEAIKHMKLSYKDIMHDDGTTFRQLMKDLQHIDAGKRDEITEKIIEQGRLWERNNRTVKPGESEAS